MCTAVITRVDTSAVLELAKHVLDLISAFVDSLVVRDLDFAVGLGWDAGIDPRCSSASRNQSAS
jgi:hypothetical protein